MQQPKLSGPDHPPLTIEGYLERLLLRCRATEQAAVFCILYLFRQKEEFVAQGAWLRKKNPKLNLARFIPKTISPETADDP